jgi:hypothetical protein
MGYTYIPSCTAIMQTSGRDVTHIDTASLTHNCDITHKRNLIVNMKTGGCNVTGVLLPHTSSVLYKTYP